MSGKAGSCKHPKSTITLFSDVGGVDVLQGAQYNLGHFDEHIREEFFHESYERLKSIDKSSLILTGTPLLGKGSWEYRRLTSVWLDKKKNKVPGTDTPYVSIHSIDQYSAGLVKKERIDESKLTMDPLEQEARIYGRPAPLAKFSVFDRYALHEMEKLVQEPTPGILKGEPVSNDPPIFQTHPSGNVRVWEAPVDGAQYVIGGDVALGLVGKSGNYEGDFSCASVLRLPHLKMVAQYHGHINPLVYAEEVAKLGRWYNMGMLVIERTGGLGISTILQLKKFNYWNLFRDLTDVSAAGEYTNLDSILGMDTNIKTKGLMVSALQRVIAERDIQIPCINTIEELRAYAQEPTETGLNMRFGGEGGSYDDRVVSLMLATYVAITFPIYDARRAIVSDEDKRVWKSLRDDISKDRKNADPFMMEI